MPDEGNLTPPPDDECAHGLSPSWCSLCLHPPKAGPSPSSTIELTFSARWPGHCAPCNLPIMEGQVIHKLSTGAYVHRGCAT